MCIILYTHQIKKYHFINNSRVRWARMCIIRTKEVCSLFNRSEAFQTHHQTSASFHTTPATHQPICARAIILISLSFILQHHISFWMKILLVSECRTWWLINDRVLIWMRWCCRYCRWHIAKTNRLLLRVMNSIHWIWNLTIFNWIRWLIRWWKGYCWSVN